MKKPSNEPAAVKFVMATTTEGNICNEMQFPIFSDCI